MITKKKVLMVCYGNTCRSPIAEAVFQKYIASKKIEEYWHVDSAALLAHHEGKDINSRSLDTLKKNGITNYSHKSRTIRKEDFDIFDWILGMDLYNIEHLGRIQPIGSRARIELLGQYDPEGAIVIEDPYFDNDNTRFEKAFEQCSRCIPVFVSKNTLVEV